VSERSGGGTADEGMDGHRRGSRSEESDKEREARRSGSVIGTKTRGMEG
jgi:hypothetical protein